MLVRMFVYLFLFKGIPTNGVSQALLSIHCSIPGNQALLVSLFCIEFSGAFWVFCCCYYFVVMFPLFNLIGRVSSKTGLVI